MQDIEGVIGAALGDINRNQNIIFNYDDDDGTYNSERDLNYGNNIVNHNVQQFFNDPNTIYTPDGTLENGATNISINTINDTQDEGRGNLPTDYTNNQQLNPAVVADAATLKNRLENCQYLEILYLTKHDELMKLFAFTLTVFNKYKYAIRILLFVLKNLLGTEPQPPPNRPIPQHDGQPHEICPPCPEIQLPKALIPNIKSLIQDQKKVQEVIEQMKETLNEDPLATPANSQRVENPPGNINDQRRPP